MKTTKYCKPRSPLLVRRGSVSGESKLRAKRRKGAVRWSYLLGLVLILVGGLLWFAPAIAAKLLRPQIVSWALSDFDGDVTVRSARLGWMSPPELHDVSACDREGNQLLTIEEIHGDKSLLSLLVNRDEIGRFQVVRPALHVRLDHESSNIEEALKFLSGGGSKRREKPTNIGATVEVEDGHVVLIDLATSRQWKIQAVNMTLKTLSSGTLDFQLDGSGTVLNDSNQTGKITAWSDDDGVVVQLKAIPLDIVEPFLHRNASDVRIAGHVTADFHCQPSREESDFSLAISGELKVAQFELVSSEYLGDDVLRLASITADGQFQITQQRLTANAVNLSTDFASLAAQGSIELSEDTDTKWIDILGGEDCAVNANVDLARLAQLLPHALKIRPGTAITSGQVQARFTSHAVADGREWNGRINTTTLVANANGRPISWRQPITIIFEARDSNSGAVVIDQLFCQSEFLNINGCGTVNSADFSANCDLNRLVQQLGQFVDLDAAQLAGNATAQLKWSRQADDQLTVDGNAVVENFQLTSPDTGLPWIEPRLTIMLCSTGIANDEGLQSIDAGNFQFVAGGDQLVAQLVQPVSFESDEIAWPIDVIATGNLASWIRRLTPWLDLTDWDVGGMMNVKALANIGSKKTDITSANLEFTSFEAHNGSLHVIEPKVQLNGTGSWDRDRRSFSSALIDMASTSLTFRATDLMFQTPDESAPSTSGTVKVRADLRRLSRWFAEPGHSPTLCIAGDLTGEIQLQNTDRMIRVGGKATIKKLVIERNGPLVTRPTETGIPVSQSDRWEQLWLEDTVKLAGEGTFNHKEDTFHLESVDVDSELLTLKVAGSVTNLEDALQADLSGKIVYDVQNIVQAIRGYVGDGFQLAGREQHPFSIRGPIGSATTSTSTGSLVSDQLVAQGTLGWESGDVYGLSLGKAELHATLTRQLVRFSPVEIRVNDGYLRGSPEILLNQDPPLLIVSQGRILDRVSITSEMCAEWLKYVAPLLADATRIDGRLSMDIDHAKVPLGDVNKSDIKGTTTVHAIEIRPGPLAERFVRIITRIRSIFRRQPLAGIDANDPRLTTSDQKVRFQVLDGRVYHEDLRMNLGDMEIHSYGSVGLEDERLAIVADLHIPNKWAQEDRLLASWAGKVIQIPIRGTLDRPDIDESVLANIVIESVPDVIDGILDRIRRRSR